MKLARLFWAFFLCLVVLIDCNQSKELAQDKPDNISEQHEMNKEQNSFDLYILAYLKQNMNTVEIINKTNILFEARNLLKDDDEINYWDLCVIEGIAKNIDTSTIINIVSNIIKLRNEYNFIDNIERNFYDLCVYELLKINYDSDILNITNDIILERRNFKRRILQNEFHVARYFNSINEYNVPSEKNNLFRPVNKMDYINNVYGEGYTRVEAYQDLFNKLGYNVEVTDRVLLEINNMRFSEYGYYALMVTHNFPTDYIESSIYDSSKNKYLYRVRLNNI